MKFTTKFPQGEDGFTLPELLITVVILGVITAAIGAAMMVVMRNSEGPARKLGPSNDANLISSYLTADVQSASVSDITATAASGCAGAAPDGVNVRNVVALSWTDNYPGTPLNYSAAYQFNQSQHTLSRISCLSGGTPSAATLGRNIVTASAAGSVSVSSIALDITALAPDAPAGDPPFTFTLKAFGRMAGSASGGTSGTGGGGGAGSGAAQLSSGAVGGIVNLYNNPNATGVPALFPGATVTVSKAGTLLATLTAGLNSRFYLGTLADGTYDVGFTAPGYAASGVGNSLTASVPVAGGFVNVPAFNVFQVGAQTGLVRLDTNAGLPGVLVTLTGPTLATYTTTATGQYSFPNLAFGSYTVTFSPPAGFTSVSGATCTFTVTGSTPGNCPDAVFHSTNTDLVGSVLVDTNNDGAGDSPHAAAVTLTLTGPVTRTTTTSGSGAFSFVGLPNGTYAISETLPGGFSAVTALPVTRVIDGVTAPAAINIVNRATVGGIGGLVRLDSGPALAGVTVSLAGVGAPVQTFITTGTGLYSFGNLSPGSYTVTFAAPNGYSLVSGGSCAQTVTTSNALTCPDAVFHNTRTDVSGTVTIDTNGDLVGEAAQNGVTVTLSNGSTTLTTTTQGGSFSFPGLANGTYTITETVPAAYGSVVGPASTRTIDGVTPPVAIGFVNRASGSVTGLSVLDNPTASGLGGVTVSLAGPVTATTTSAGTGAFGFGFLPPGNYTATFTPPAGYSGAPGNPCSFTISSATPVSCPNAVFHNKKLDISGTIFRDTNGDAVGETAIGGVTVTATKGATTFSTVSAPGTGAFSFIGLTTGTWTITETVAAPDIPVSGPSSVVVIDDASIPSALSYVNRFQCSITANVTTTINIAGGKPKNNEVVAFKMNSACIGSVTFDFPAAAPGTAGPSTALTNLTSTFASSSPAPAVIYTSENLKNQGSWTTGAAPHQATLLVRNNGLLIGTIAVTVQ